MKKEIFINSRNTFINLIDIIVNCEIKQII